MLTIIPVKFSFHFSNVYIIFYEFVGFKRISKILKGIHKLEKEKCMNSTRPLSGPRPYQAGLARWPK
jgi:hypothetical protein